METATDEDNLTTPLGVRKLYWYQYVNGLFELEALFSKYGDKAGRVQDFAGLTLINGIVQAHTLFYQEKWSRHMPEYPTTLLKLQILDHAFQRHWPGGEAPKAWVSSVEDLLMSISAVQDLINTYHNMVRMGLTPAS